MENYDLKIIYLEILLTLVVTFSKMLFKIKSGNLEICLKPNVKKEGKKM